MQVKSSNLRVLGVALLLQAGCRVQPATTDPGGARFVDSYERIQATGRITVGVLEEDSPASFCFKNAAGQFVGFDPDFVQTILAPAIGERLGLDLPPEVELVNLGWPAIYESMGNKPDFTIASISIFEEREKSNQIKFSTPYLETRVAVVSLQEGTEIQSNDAALFPVTQLADKRVLVDPGTSASYLLDETGGADFLNTPATFAKSNDQMFAWLEAGKADVFLYDYVRAQRIVEKHPVSGKRWVVRGLEFRDIQAGYEAYGLVFRESDNRLRKVVDTVMVKNKTQIAALLDRHHMRSLPASD